MSRSLADSRWPAWLREIDSLLAVHPHFVLSGNVRDRYSIPGPDLQITDGITEALGSALEVAGYSGLLVHDIVDGYRMVSTDADAAWADLHSLTGLDVRSATPTDLDLLARVVRGFATGGAQRVGFALDYASRLVANANDLGPREHAFFSACLKYSHEAVRSRHPRAERALLYNPVVWIVDREHDLPAWLTAGSRVVRSIPVPWPELPDRSALARLLLQAHTGQVQARAAETVAARTDGMGSSSLFDVAVLLRDQQLDPADAEDAMRIYTLGAAESPWSRGAVERRLREHDLEADLALRVLGQPEAVVKAVDILKRSVLGLSGAQAGRSSNRPRGVLFFAGPTGVGKTELAKAITELVFGTQDAYIRFDMSEFSSEHAGDRLVGAPPGYVGFEGGGELTNAVRRKPYSLLLFDEVDKAHPRILDKFLQLLDDGRLTDGRGTTVHFSETIIVFTSNLGMTKPDPAGGDRRVSNVEPGEPRESMEQKVLAEIRRYFTEDLNRPELLNRVGDNVVVFNFIEPEVAIQIADLMIGNIAAAVSTSRGVTIALSDRARQRLHTILTADLSFGGRGIGNLLESRFVNPLARALFAVDPAHGSTVRVLDVATGGVPAVQLG